MGSKLTKQELLAKNLTTYDQKTLKIVLNSTIWLEKKPCIPTSTSVGVRDYPANHYPKVCSILHILYKKGYGYFCYSTKDDIQYCTEYSEELFKLLSKLPNISYYYGVPTYLEKKYRIVLNQENEAYFRFKDEQKKRQEIETEAEIDMVITGQNLSDNTTPNNTINPSAPEGIEPEEGMTTIDKPGYDKFGK